jgi:hypothetical protein
MSTNLSIHLCDASASLVLTSASFADQSISSSYSTSSSYAGIAGLLLGSVTNAITASYAILSDNSISSSWAPNVSTGLTTSVTALTDGGSSCTSMVFVNGLLISTNKSYLNNVLNLYNASSILPVLSIQNPTGEIQEQNNTWTSIIGVGCVNITQLVCYTNHSLTYINLSGSISLNNLDCNDNTSLASIDISGNPALTTVFLYGNALTQPCVDNVLHSLVIFGLSNGTVQLQDSLSAQPSTAGYASSSILTSRGWSVTTN